MTAAGQPPVQQIGDAVIIRGEAISPLYYSVMAGVREARRNGHSITPYVALQAATLAAHRSKSDTGHEHPESKVAQQQSERQGDDDLLSIAEAAALSGYCARQVRRKAQAGHGHRVGTSWVMTRGAALALKQQRTWKARNGTRHLPAGMDAAPHQGTASSAGRSDARP